MKIVQFIRPKAASESAHRVGLVQGQTVIDLTACPPYPTSIYEIYYAHGGRSEGLEKAVEGLDARDAPRLSLDDLLNNTSDPERPYLTLPVSPPPDAPHRLRVWLAGVTHADSAQLREIEAKQATGASVNVYEQKYRECARGGIPELFAKTDPEGLVGHGGRIARPPDTIRLVPETELVTVYGLNARGQVERLGYTGGNDYTDNGIEAENPLNLPQAKNWHGGCASLGPVFVTGPEFDDTHVPVSCEIIRNGRRVAFKAGHTGRANLNMPDGLYHLERSLFGRLPLKADTLQIFYWGTPIVFAEGDLKNGLQEGDTVRMRFGGGIGTLENTICAFPGIQQLQWLEERHRPIEARGAGATAHGRAPRDPV